MQGCILVVKNLFGFPWDNGAFWCPKKVNFKVPPEFFKTFLVLVKKNLVMFFSLPSSPFSLPPTLFPFPLPFYLFPFFFIFSIKPNESLYFCPPPPGWWGANRKIYTSAHKTKWLIIWRGLGRHYSLMLYPCIVDNLV